VATPAAPIDARELALGGGAPPPPLDAGSPADTVAPAKKIPESRIGKSHGELPDAEPPPRVAADLKDAERLFASGDYRGARHRAESTLYVFPTARAYALITRSYCGEGDVGGARASLHAVPRAELAGVKAYCRKAGMDLR
jgi:hypothetical protein